MLPFIKRCRAMKSTEINETLYSRIDQAKFVEKSLTGTKWVNPTGLENQYHNIKYKTKSKSQIQYFTNQIN